MTEYDLEISRVLEEIKRADAKTVGLQFPEGLKSFAVDIARKIKQDSTANVLIFIDPVYGACDTRDAEAEMLGVDLVVHFGHTEFL